MFVTQSCLTLCDPVDCSSADSPTHGIFQPRIPEWVAISFCRGSSQSGNWTCVFCISCTGRWILYQLSDQWFFSAAAAAKSLQLSLTLCNSIDGRPPGTPIPGILQARTLEWAAISFSNAWKWKMKSLSHVQLFTTPWTAAHQAPLPMGFSRQEYWSGSPLPSPDFSLALFNCSCWNKEKAGR